MQLLKEAARIDGSDKGHVDMLGAVADSMNSKLKKRINPLWMMLILFGIPYFISWYTYYTGDTLFLKAGKSQGQLISPVRALPDFELKDIDGNIVQRQQFIGKWTLLLTGPSSCNEACLQSLWSMRQLRLALSVDRRRVQRVFLTGDTEHLPALREKLSSEHHGLKVFSLDNSAASQGVIKTLQAEGNLNDFSLYIVDPIGNVMMYYPPATEGKKVLKDLERLIKFSKVGDPS